MRICIVAPALPPAVGGAEVIADSIIRLLVAQGGEVDVVAGVPDAAVRELVQNAGGTYRFVGRELAADTIAWEYDTFARADALFAHFAQRPPDIVHAFSHDAAVAVAIAGPRAPVIATFNEMATEQPGFGQARSRFVYSLPAISLLTVSSDFYRDVALRYGYPRDRIRLVVTGVDVTWLRSGSPERGRQLVGLPADGRPVVLCPSRFTPRKGQLDLVSALARLERPRPLVVLLGSAHSGSIAYLRQVEERIAALDVAEDVHIVEGIAHRDMPDVYAACDVVVQPSHGEGLGLAALESMATGRPLLATAVSGFDSFLEHGHNALVVPPGDPDALATQLRRLLTDAATRTRISERASADVWDRFDIRRTAEEVLAVYDEALGRTPVAPR